MVLRLKSWLKTESIIISYHFLSKSRQQEIWFCERFLKVLSFFFLHVSSNLQYSLMRDLLGYRCNCLNKISLFDDRSWLINFNSVSVSIKRSQYRRNKGKRFPTGRSFFVNFVFSLTHLLPMHPFSTPLKTSENFKVFRCFQVQEKGCIGN